MPEVRCNTSRKDVPCDTGMVRGPLEARLIPAFYHVSNLRCREVAGHRSPRHFVWRSLTKESNEYVRKLQRGIRLCGRYCFHLSSFLET
jgi:hypothetical protein